MNENSFDHFFYKGTESLIKINDNKFSYAYLKSNDIVIVIFDLYGINKKSLLIRYYIIYSILYNFFDILKINLFKFNSF